MGFSDQNDVDKETEELKTDGHESSLSLDEFRAELDVFTGPLDLLLHLIKRDEVDILEIPISRITDSYLTALNALRMFDINIAAEFLVMAATLMDIKSRTLLPNPIEEDEEDDPKDQLIHQLLQYKKYKLLAKKLKHRADKQALTFPRIPPPAESEPEEVEADTMLDDIDIWDLVSAYAEIIREIEMSGPRHIIYDEIPVAQYMEEVLEQVNRERGEKDFLSFFRHDRSRPRVIGVFLALLELLKNGEVQLIQKEDDRSRIIISKAESKE